MAGRIAVDLDVHHNCVRLLNLPYLSQLNAVTESRREVGAKGVVAHVSRGHARHEEKQGRTAEQDHQHQGRRDLRQREGKTPVLLGIVRVFGLNAGRMSGTAHFHQHKRSHGHQHEYGEGEQENAVDRQDRGCQHHQESQDGEHDVVPLAAQREHPHDHAEQSQVHRRRQESTGQQKVVDGEKKEVGDRKRRGQTLGNHKQASFG